MKSEKTYIAIDLKSFYASVECVERGLNPLNAHLVVADASRTEKTICLAVSPSLKSYGISGRARLFEVVQRIGEVNRERKRKNRGRDFTGKSVYADELAVTPELEASYVIAPPRMAHYIRYSKKIYKIYLKYIAPEDIHVYSIDEVILDATEYLGLYKMTAHELAIKMIRDVLATTGITATAGIGTNMYLCKVAMDIVAKHIPADKDGVRIAELDEKAYRRTLWCHTPLTDFWRVGKGIAERLEPYGIITMGDIARCSLCNEELLYRLFGVNAEFLIDHAWGWESSTISQVKAYRPENNSFSSGQVLSEPYTVDKARIVIREMADSIALDLVDKKMVTDQLVMMIGYDKDSLDKRTGFDAETEKLTLDNYGRPVPENSRGTANLGTHTSSTKKIVREAVSLYDNIVKGNCLIRRLTICTNHVLPEDSEKLSEKPVQLDLFTDYEEQERQKEIETEDRKKERNVQETILNIQKRYGKNSILKGTDFAEGATTRDRNGQIGGHKA